MSLFENVAVMKAATVYFDGAVTSRKVLFADGSSKTLGIMQPGEYEFGTEKKELMEITAGRVDILLPGEDWRTVKGGESFYVPANSSFSLRVAELVDYCCSYLDE